MEPDKVANIYKHRWADWNDV